MCKIEITGDAEITHAQTKQQEAEEISLNSECKTAHVAKMPQMSLDQLLTV